MESNEQQQAWQQTNSPGQQGSNNSDENTISDSLNENEDSGPAGTKEDDAPLATSTTVYQDQPNQRTEEEIIKGAQQDDQLAAMKENVRAQHNTREDKETFGSPPLKDSDINRGEQDAEHD